MWQKVRAKGEQEGGLGDALNFFPLLHSIPARRAGWIFLDRGFFDVRGQRKWSDACRQKPGVGTQFACDTPKSH